MSGEGDEQTIGSETLTEAIREARIDTAVKAIVLRVNSPGGNALASDVIWRELELAKSEKPLIVSMGDMATSGGYYISAPANKIYAMPNTITGSIGVFMILPNMQGFFNEKIGLTFDNVETSEYADFGGVTRPLTADERLILQKSVDETYDLFLTRVSNGRNLSMAQVDSLGQGRVWSGENALEIGLVDEIGGLEDAIAEAAQMANIEDYRIKELPKLKDPFQKLLEDLNMASAEMALDLQFGGDQMLIREFKRIKSLKEMSGIQARLPYEFEVH
jgi:protease-4